MNEGARHEDCLVGPEEANGGAQERRPATRHSQRFHQVSNA